MSKQEIIDGPIAEAVQQWEKISEVAESASNEDIARELAGLALNQFRLVHELINEELEGLNCRSTELINNGPENFYSTAARELNFIGQRRADLVEFTHSLYPAKEEQPSEVDEVKIDGFLDNIREELEENGLSVSAEEELILKHLLSNPGSELRKKDFIVAGFPDSYPALFTGTVSALVDKVNRNSSRLRIEKVTGRSGGKTRSYKLTLV